jgi:hypothetical protein
LLFCAERVRALSDVLKIVSAVTSSLLASLRFVIALILALFLLWILGEMAWTVWHGDYRWLAIFFFVAFVAIIGGTIWRCWKPQQFGEPAASSESLNIVPLTVLNVIRILVALFISWKLNGTLRTPLLRFCKNLIDKLTS